MAEECLILGLLLWSMQLTYTEVSGPVTVKCTFRHHTFLQNEPQKSKRTMKRRKKGEHSKTNFKKKQFSLSALNVPMSPPSVISLDFN